MMRRRRRRMIHRWCSDVLEMPWWKDDCFVLCYEYIQVDCWLNGQRVVYKIWKIWFCDTFKPDSKKKSRFFFMFFSYFRWSTSVLLVKTRCTSRYFTMNELCNNKVSSLSLSYGHKGSLIATNNCVADVDWLQFTVCFPNFELLVYHFGGREGTVGHTHVCVCRYLYQESRYLLSNFMMHWLI